MADKTVKKAIIVGTSTGIGRALAKKLSAEGYVVGLTGRDEEKLKALQAELPGESFTRKIDLRDARESIHSFANLLMVMHGAELVVVNAGILHVNEQFQWEREEEMIRVNALGFAAIANVAVNYFLNQKKGCLVGISSVAGHRGSGRSPAYNASKAFMINYMEGLRQKLSATPVRVVDIRPGFVDTDMVRGRKGLFGVISPEKAAEEIYGVILKGKRVAYIPSWWRGVMWLLRRVPESFYHWGYRTYIAWDHKPKTS
ncbi:MAG TPA: SDR family NAD(P)-dependent oxidoreductase [Candidatus Omnitrophota bacterium]|nr:SDR family NAD(P)-dependent oxidoreductase [Candidatus Omnitrophota bacterium]HPS36447.1 SDR family NAD(P)-dependent oxidoreductase [Candidatus Omnitrophota bacterium]